MEVLKLIFGSGIIQYHFYSSLRSSRHSFPNFRTKRTSMSTMANTPAQKVYSPPSPILSCGSIRSTYFCHNNLKATHLEGNSDFGCDECKYSPVCTIRCYRRRRATYVGIDDIGESTTVHPPVSRKKAQRLAGYQRKRRPTPRTTQQ